MSRRPHCDRCAAIRAWWANNGFVSVWAVERMSREPHPDPLDDTWPDEPDDVCRGRWGTGLTHEPAPWHDPAGERDHPCAICSGTGERGAA